MKIVLKFDVVLSAANQKIADGEITFDGAKDADLTPTFDCFRDSGSYSNIAELAQIPNGFEILNAELCLMSGRKIIKRKPFFNEDKKGEPAK